MIKPLNPGLAVTAQIEPTDMTTLVASGFRTLINHRHDGESPDQPSSDTRLRTAQEAGLAYHHLPVLPGAIEDAQVLAFRQLLASAEKPVLAFCRTGIRAISLWALGSCDDSAPASLLHAAQAAGYDLSDLLPRLQGRQGQR
ncbi:TIGR01244 family sulfur transferase [Stutzerimonas kirkiae]|uniref:TIGR01244 family sulfur transferase n=1 Tax=Stutzerimonas kirkiae TaxID=2211392 RepID=UPI0010384D8A|nr:TIGR01244 family sulfur transferase [Stutzerimonas kirkiae]TBV10313.1 TIGR01244 family phosphatase [Stutzerimonas kirkiae]TBV16894.1 TIGR01244 family phosphatase [Stutzerimonas kirkiae]